MTPVDILRKGLLVFESCMVVALLVLFGVAYPDRIRTRLWENGGVEGWNSNPKERTYFDEHHRELPEVPLIWSQRLTNSNFAIAALCFIIFLVRLTLDRFRYLPRYLNVLYDTLLFCLCTWSISGQTSGDYSDPEHSSSWPWYLSRGCGKGVCWDENLAACRTAQASLAVSCVAAGLYGTRIVVEVMLAVMERRKGYKSLEQNDIESEKMKMKMLGVPHIQEQALSPVLAFFPEDAR